MWVQLQPSLVFTVRDATGSTVTVRFNAKRGSTVTQIMAAADGLRGVLAGMVDVVFIRQTVTFTTVNQAPGHPQPDSRVGNTGTFIFAGADDDQYALVPIPGWAGALETEGALAGIAIDQTDPDVQAFSTAVTDGIYQTPWGDDLERLTAAYVQRRE